jgi:hypothetical protein
MTKSGDPPSLSSYTAESTVLRAAAAIEDFFLNPAVKKAIILLL